MGWSIGGSLMFQRTTRGQTLNVIVIQVPHAIGWQVTAVSFSTPIHGWDRGVDEVNSSVDAVFASHGHENLGVKRTLLEAVQFAEAYATKWEQSAERCGCGPIGEHLDVTNSARACPDDPTRSIFAQKLS